MQCLYCGSSNIIISNGEYVCRICGSVLGPVLYFPRPRQREEIRRRAAVKILLNILNEETRKGGPYRAEERMRKYLEELAAAFSIPQHIVEYAEGLYKSLDKRKIQGKNPRVLAGTLVYIAINEYKLNIDKSAIANKLNISKLSIRDTATLIRKYVQRGIHSIN